MEQSFIVHKEAPMAGCLSCQVPYDRYLELSLFVFSLLCVLNIWGKMLTNGVVAALDL